MLLGFIASRQPAIWMGDWGQVSFMAQKEDAELNYADRGLRIEKEKYTPYSGTVVAGEITTRFTALEHSAIFRFSDARHFVVDVSRLSGGQYSDPDPHPGHIEFSEDGYTLSGWNSDLFDGAHTSPKPNFKGYFYIEFSRPYVDSYCSGNDQDEVQGVVTFAEDGPLMAKIGLSLISVEQARSNLKQEVGERSFRSVKRLARKRWEDQFNKINIDASDDVKTIFYTALYHSLLYPRKIKLK
jgi:putative alpha-1,2-mannosidase